MRTRRRYRAGFTLLEVLLVLAILGVIAVMVVPQLMGRQQKANISVTRSSIKGLESALKLYGVDHDGELPQGSQDALEQLLHPSDEDEQTEPYVENINDAWDEMLFYRYPGTKQEYSSRPDIWSSGPNRKNEDGGGDDINNWDEEK